MTKTEILIFEVVKNNLKNRKIVVGDNNIDFANKCETIFGENNVMVLADAPKQIDKYSYISNESLNGKSEEYYILFPSSKQTELSEQLYAEMGYKEINDILWIRHKTMNINKSSNVGGYCSTIDVKSDITIEVNGWGNDIKIGANVKIPAKIRVGNNVKLSIGNDVTIKSGWFGDFNECEMTIGDNCKFGVNINIWCVKYSSLSIGKNCSMGNDLILRSHSYTNIKIGDNCLFSWNCVVLGGDGHAIFNIDNGRMINNPKTSNQNVIIGDHVWFGGEVTVLPGSKIEENCVVGYKSIIKGSFPNNVCIAGNPGKIIRHNEFVF